MSKTLGVLALLIAIIALVIPGAGGYITVLVALLAIFSFGKGYSLGITAIIISIVNIAIISPMVWAMPLIGVALIVVQVVALVLLIVFNSMKSKPKKVIADDKK
ncbi:MAG: hypothetical protein DRQ51_04680 [Gammaproteobacteria bacterium]|nr:MAG: hypothetical protein DRQ51_04680 [Gammaproteobacteria bacterium]